MTERLRVKGVAVLRVTPGSAAESAGIRGARIEQNGTIVPGDIIVEMDGASVDSVARLLGRLDERRIGETVRLTLLRDGQKREVSVTLQGASR